MRIGFGYDVHRLVPGRPLILGGVKLPWNQGLLGHSDADVLLHAIMDALLGAAALGDIGTHFSDTDPQYKDVSSLLLLAYTRDKIAEAGFICQNIDCTLIAEEPKIKPYVPQMIENISQVLRISPGQVSIKATTNEGMGFAGRREGMAAYAVCLLSAALGA